MTVNKVIISGSVTVLDGFHGVYLLPSVKNDSKGKEAIILDHFKGYMPDVREVELTEIIVFYDYVGSPSINVYYNIEFYDLTYISHIEYTERVIKEKYLRNLLSDFENHNSFMKQYFD